MNGGSIHGGHFEVHWSSGHVGERTLSEQHCFPLDLRKCEMTRFRISRLPVFTEERVPRNNGEKRSEQFTWLLGRVMMLITTRVVYSIRLCKVECMIY